jgi:hypothetical protein
MFVLLFTIPIVHGQHFLFQASNPSSSDTIPTLTNVGCISRLGNCIQFQSNNSQNDQIIQNDFSNNNNNECRTFNRISVARIFCQCTPNCIEVGNESESSFDESGNKSDSNFIVKCNLPKPKNTRSIADGSAAVARVPVFCQFIPFL